MFRQASRFIRSLSQDIVNVAPQFYDDTKLVAQEAFILYPYLFNDKQRGFTLGHVANPYGQDDPIAKVCTAIRMQPVSHVSSIDDLIPESILTFPGIE